MRNFQIRVLLIVGTELLVGFCAIEFFRAYFSL